MAVRVPGSPTRPRRRTIVPLPLKREVSEQPVYQPPRPAPRPAPIPDSETSRVARKEQREYNRAGWNMFEAIKARREELRARDEATGATKQFNQMAEEAEKEKQEDQLRGLAESMRPETPSATYLQAAAFRGKRGLPELEEEARDAEAQANLAKFSDWWRKASPQEQTSLSGVSMGLAKESMSASSYKRIIDAAKRDDFTAPREEREKAQRVLQAQTETMPTLEQAVPTLLPEDEKGDDGWLRQIMRGELPSREDFLGDMAPLTDPGTYIDIGKGVGRVAKGTYGVTKGTSEIVAAPFASNATVKGGASDVYKGIRDIFGGEQEAVTPLTGPLIRGSLDNLGFSDDSKDWVDRHVTPYVVPTTFVGPGAIKGGARVLKIPARAATEGLINVFQGDAAAEREGRERSNIERSIDFVAGGAVRGGLDILGPVVGKLLGRDGAAEVADSIADEVNPPRLTFRDAATPRDTKLGRHTIEALDDSGKPVGKLEWREPPAGEPGVAHVASVSVDEPLQGRGIGSALRRHVMDDMAERGYTDVTSDISTPAGAKLASRSGATFETRVGDSLTPDEAVEEAALGLRGRGPRSRTKLDTRAGAESPPTTTPETAAPARAVEVAEGEDLVGLRAEVDELTRVKAAGERVGRRLGTAKRKLAQAEAAATLRPVGRRLGEEAGGGKLPGGEPEPELGTQRPRAEAEVEAAAAAETPPPSTTPKRFKKGDTIYNRKGQPQTFVKHGGKDNPGMVWVKGAGKKKPTLIPRRGLTLTSPTETPLPIEPHKVRFRETEGTVDKLGHLVRTSKRLRGEQLAIAAETQQRQLGAAHGALETALAKPGRKPGEAVAAFKAQLRGKRNLPIIDPPRQYFTDPELNDLGDLLRRRYPTRDFDYINADEALGRLMDGYPLAPHQIQLLQGVLPDDVLTHTAKLTKGIVSWIGRELGAIINLPRLIQIVDPASSLLRQGGLAITHPKEYAKFARDSVKILFSENYTDDLVRNIANDPDYLTIRDFGLRGVAKGKSEGGAFDGIDEHISDMISRGDEAPPGWAPRGKAKAPLEERLTTGEGAFVDRMMDAIPGVKQAGRTFRVGLGALRFYLQKQHYGMFRKAGMDDDAIGGMINFFNRATGRGTLGPLNKEGPVLNQIFYAARLVASRVQVPAHLFHKSSAVRLLAARDILGYAGVVSGALYAAHLAGMPVEIDPRSANWGKLLIGPTRIDLTAGFGPIVRLAARLSTEVAGGKGVKTDLGDFRDMDIRDAVFAFVESKLAPSASIATEVTTGETFEGRKLEANWESARTMAMNRAVPLFVQSMVEAVREGGWPQLPWAAGEMIGLGTMTYTTPSAKIFDLISEDIQKGLIDPDDYPELKNGIPKYRSELHPEDQQAFEKRHAIPLSDIEKHFKLQKQDSVSTTYQAAEEISTETTDRVSDMERAVADGSMTLEDFRLGISELKSDKVAAQAVISKVLELQGVDPDERPDTPGVLQDLYDYGAIFDSYPNADTIPSEGDALFDNIDSYRAKIGPERADALDDQLNLGFKESPLYRELTTDREQIEDSGYFDRSEAVWEDVRDMALDQGYDLPDDYYAYRRQVETEKGEAAVDRNPWIRIFTRRSEPFLNRWRQKHPDALALVLKWGYKDASALDAAILRSHGIEY